MTKSDQERCNVRSIPKQSKRHDGVFSKLSFAEYKKNRHEKSEYNQANHLRRFPRKSDTSKVQTKEEHDGQTYNGQATKPVDSHDTSDEARSGIVNVKKEEHYQESETGAWKVYPPNPSPRDQLSKSTPKDRSHATG